MFGPDGLRFGFDKVESRMPSQAEDFLQKLFGLQGQIVAVNGGAGRIGSVLCRALVQAGAEIAVLDIDEGRSSQLCAELERESGRRAMAIRADTTVATDIDQAVEQITRHLGSPTALVNCSQFRGKDFYSSDVCEYPLDAWEQVLRTNLTGVFLACQAFARFMKKAGGGSIVNFSSTYGVVSPDPRIYGDSGVNSPVSYAASKSGIINLTRYLAIHLRNDGIRVNCLVPGGVFDQQGDEFVKQYTERTPLGRMASADDYRGAVIYLLSAASAYMTGSIVTVDGGWTAW